MKFCNFCGHQLSLEKATELEKREKRFDDYVDGVFWISVFGLGLLLGGMTIIKEVLHLGQGVLIAFLVMGSAAFLTVFGVCLWQVIQLSREIRKINSNVDDEQYDTNKLAGEKNQLSLAEPNSIVEETTRTLESTQKEKVVG